MIKGQRVMLSNDKANPAQPSIQIVGGSGGLKVDPRRNKMQEGTAVKMCHFTTESILPILALLTLVGVVAERTMGFSCPLRYSMDLLSYRLLFYYGVSDYGIHIGPHDRLPPPTCYCCTMVILSRGC